MSIIPTPHLQNQARSQFLLAGTLAPALFQTLGLTINAHCLVGQLVGCLAGWLAGLIVGLCRISWRFTRGQLALQGLQIEFLLARS